ncbi:putative transcription factor C2H2 family [Medicago truncatula]|uniref:Putative transcription factor C2H2 family n=1 Tax=Medicago truncatula TaxID=3880 RepID=A0A396H015_MEDTR|nr:putative transcription factor C2H2 family [Medicago truncatula]
MAKTPKFVYAMILLLSIFLIKIVSGSNTLLAFRECVYDKDCPVMPRCNMRCRKGITLNKKAFTHRKTHCGTPIRIPLVTFIISHS